jgi:3-methylcrotonyl-CoA carboxylase beta subunit
MERDRTPIDRALIDKLKEDTRADYMEQMSAYYSTSQLWDDGILDPVDTRNTLGVAITASMNAPLGEPGYGVFRF